MKIVRLLPKQPQEEKIFQQEKDAAAHSCSALSGYFAAPAEREDKLLLYTIGFAQAAAINLRHDF